MKKKSNAWVTISDLMAGVLAIVMLLLVVSVLQQVYAHAKHLEIQNRQEKEIEAINYVIDNQKKQANKILKQIQQMFAERKLDDLLHVDFDEFKIMLKEGLFMIGSACIRSEVKEALSLTRQYLNDYFIKNPIGLIQIEGHTDDRPVAQPVINYQKFCTVYDDNYTLSAARAREAMRSIWITSPDYQNRIIVAGFGSSRPIDKYLSNDPVQRRVEITFTFPSLQDIKTIKISKDDIKE